jgi:hypothetical protein
VTLTGVLGVEQVDCRDTHRYRPVEVRAKLGSDTRRNDVQFHLAVWVFTGVELTDQALKVCLVHVEMAGRASGDARTGEGRGIAAGDPQPSISDQSIQCARMDPHSLNIRPRSQPPAPPLYGRGMTQQMANAMTRFTTEVGRERSLHPSGIRAGLRLTRDRLLGGVSQITKDRPGMLSRHRPSRRPDTSRPVTNSRPVDQPRPRHPVSSQVTLASEPTDLLLADLQLPRGLHHAQPLHRCPFNTFVRELILSPFFGMSRNRFLTEPISGTGRGANPRGLREHDLVVAVTSLESSATSSDHWARNPGPSRSITNASSPQQPPQVATAGRPDGENVAGVDTQPHRAMLHHADGRTEEVGADVPVGFFPNDPDNLHFYRTGGWQQSDDEHPPDHGSPGYRVAYKTLKMLTSTDIELKWPNLRISVKTGHLNYGGMRTPDGVPARRPDEQVVPEYGMRITDSTGAARWLGCPNPYLTFAGWDDDIGGLSYVEIIYRLEDDADPEPEAVRQAGRAAVAPLKTTLDLILGPRLLGVPLLEEIGAVFDDWHWNRRLDSVALATERPLQPVVMPAQEFVNRIMPAIEHTQQVDETERRRFRLASQWYWLADAEPDPVNRFIQMWLVIESLEMPTPDIAPVKARLTALLGGKTVGAFVGRLYGTRSGLVHGNAATVTPEQIEQVDTLAKLFLLDRLGQPAPAELARVGSWIAPSPS